MGRARGNSYNAKAFVDHRLPIRGHHRAQRTRWGWELPVCFSELRRLMEVRLNKGGRREYVQVLRLLETFRLEEVTQAIE